MDQFLWLFSGSNLPQAMSPVLTANVCPGQIGKGGWGGQKRRNGYTRAHMVEPPRSGRTTFISSCPHNKTPRYYMTQTQVRPWYASYLAILGKSLQKKIMLRCFFLNSSRETAPSLTSDRLMKTVSVPVHRFGCYRELTLDLDSKYAPWGTLEISSEIRLNSEC